MNPRRPIKALRRAWRRLPREGVQRGIPPSWLGYRWVQSETVKEYFLRTGLATGNGRIPYETIHAASVSQNPLPRNVRSLEDLPADRGWWGFSFRDVPGRRNGETFRATLPECRVATVVDGKGRFWVTVVNRDGRALELREMAFRAWHAPVLRSRPAVRLKRATWICERVYHNYSHWLTAHLPKLLLLERRGELGDVLLPARRPAVVDQSLWFYGFDPGRFATFEPGQLLEVEELTLVGTDRFRPELLRSVRDACAIPAPEARRRKVFISRAGAARRRLVNEDEIRPLLEAAGFEFVRMEELPFAAQVALMRRTSILFAPHGAGLTNMLFCPPGTQVIEIADPGFPNPNFYAVASAMGLPYWLLGGEALGDVHPLEKDLRVDPAEVEALLPRLLEAR